MRKIILLTALLICFGFAFAQNKYFEIYTDSVALKNDNDALIKDFENQVKKIDKKVDFKRLHTIIEDNSPIGYYLDKTNIIYLPFWETMPPLFKDFGTELTGSKKQGDKLAGLFYYGFFLPHEIAHGLQFNAKKRFNNEYDNEYEANVLAVLYWKKQGKHKELKACYKMAKKVLKNLKNPIPKDEDKKGYFTTHYEEFTQDPKKYGYIMFAQIKDAFEDKTLPDFDSYIRKLLERK